MYSAFDHVHMLIYIKKVKIRYFSTDNLVNLRRINGASPVNRKNDIDCLAFSDR